MVKGRAIRSRAGIALIFCTLVLFASCGGGGAQVQPEPGRYSLSGVVANANGTPLAGVELLLGLSPASTGIDGRYSYDNLLTGQYLLCLQDNAGNYAAVIVVIKDQDLVQNLQLPAAGSQFRAVSVEPPLNSVAAPLNGPFVVTFSASVDASSVNESSFTFTPDLEDVALQVAGTEVIITPLRQLPLDQVYLVEGSAGIANSGGQTLASPVRWRFRTAATDTEPPVLISTNPLTGKTNHPPNLGLIFEFNEPIAQPSAGLQITVTPPTNTDISSGGAALFIQPDTQWAKNTQYTVTISGISDSAGNSDGATSHAVSFTTGSTPAPSANVQPEWNSVLNRIVFASNRFGSYDIYSIAPDGTGLSRLTNLPGDELQPTVSADGTLLAFQTRTAGSKWKIAVQNIATAGDPREITTGQFHDTEPVFSRTLTNEIFFVSERSDPAGIYLMNTDGSGPTDIDPAFGSAQYNPAPHPLLNNQLLFAAYRGSSLDVWRKSISAIDLNVVNLNLTNDTLAEEHSPAWGPDASFIVYISNEDGTDNLWVADASGEFPRQVTGFSTPLDDPAVSPSQGEQLCVASLSVGGGGSDLIIIDLVSGVVTANLTQPEAGD